MKMTVDDLAIFGGPCAFPEMLHVGRPNIGDRQRLLNRINDMLDRRWLTNNGVYVQEFEQRIADLVGVKHCIAVCNATVGLEIVIRAAGLTGEVIVPSFTFVATAHALQWQEITPVFADIGYDTHTIDPVAVERMITPRTSGIIGVHVWGRACEIEALNDIAQRYNLRLLFDAAHALACSYKGKMIGRFGDAEVFSFHATKFFNSFEGGAIVTDDDDLAHTARLMRNFGFAGYDNVVYVGTNGKMCEPAAAMGLTSLESLDEFIEINYRNYKCYQKALKDTSGISVVQFNEAERSNYQYIILVVDESLAGINRNQLVDILHAENVLARRYFYPGCHQMEPYRSYFPHSKLLLPNTEKLTTQVMSLPTGTAMDEGKILEVCHILKYVIAHSSDVRYRYKVA